LELNPEAPDLVAALQALARDIIEQGGRPAVFIVDSLIEGYGIGTSTPRISVDAVMKFAVSGGCGLVLCEETRDATQSPWVFAADVVLELGVESRERGRWIEVRKNRFGPSVSGRHELDLRGWTHPAVFPEPHAWLARHVLVVLARHGWVFQEKRGMPPLVWCKEFPLTKNPTSIEGALVFIESRDTGLARLLALGLLPSTNQVGRDLLLEFDPLLLTLAAWDLENISLRYLPIVRGAAQILRTLIEQFTRVIGVDGSSPFQRIVIGNLGFVLASPDALRWVEVVRAFAGLVMAFGYWSTIAMRL
jgi:hypothetical protein